MSPTACARKTVVADLAVERFARASSGGGAGAGEGRVTEQDQARPVYAGLVTRAIAIAIDLGIANLLAVVTLAIIGVIRSALGFSGSVELAGILAGATGWFVWLTVYFVTFWTITGQTPGDRLIGIRVVTDSRWCRQVSLCGAPLLRDGPMRHPARRRLYPGAVRRPAPRLPRSRRRHCCALGSGGCVESRRRSRRSRRGNRG